MRNSTLWAIGDFMRHLKGRLMPPGGDVATAVKPDDREAFYPIAGRVIMAKGFTINLLPKPSNFFPSGENPGPDDLIDGKCWCGNDVTDGWAASWEYREPDPLADDVWLSANRLPYPGNLP
jgi:hypothetical protein